jgi:Spy/CpxP family protein refolding chaperone
MHRIMHPGMLYWWKYARRHPADWGAWAGCGPAASGDWAPRHMRASAHSDYAGAAFGVRRPLRFLAYKLELDETQVSELARILNELKTERAQAEVDGQRTVAAFADAIAGGTFDDASAAAGAALRVQSAERLRDASLKALRRIHALLDPEQRATLAYLIRTGTVAL